MNIQVIHTHQGWLVVGGGLPRDACWSEHETEGDALAAAYELAEDLCLEVQS